MELKINKNDLLNAVNTVSKSVPLKSSLPILSCISFTVGNDEIRLTSNDTEIETDVFVSDGNIIEDGKIAVESHVFVPIIQKLPDGEVTLKTEDGMMNIKCGRAKFNIPVRDGEEFPFMDIVANDNNITLSQGELKELIRQTVFATSTNDGNKIMTGELFEIKDNKLKIVALDGHRIAIREKKLTDSEDISVIIPAKTLLNIIKILGDGDIEIIFSNNMAAFKFDNTVVTSRLIDGQYFEIEKMMTDEYITTLEVNRNELISCLERAVLLINGQDRKPVIFNISDKLETEMTTNLGSSTESLEIIKTGEDIQIGFNPAFILDALRAIDEDTVKMYFSGLKAPCFIRGEDYTHLILPIQINR